MSTPETRPVFDVHAHLAGFGCGGTGCYFNPRRARSLAFRFIRRLSGLPALPRLRRGPDGRYGPDPARPGHFDAELRERLFAQAREAHHALVALGMDWRRRGDGAPYPEKTDFFTPNDYVRDLARAAPPLAGGYPAVRAGPSIHPYRPDALEALRRAADEGAALIKWLPTSQDIDPADPRCRPFYRALARLGMPLLAHTGSEGATRNINKKWNDPRVLVPALEAGVTVIAAHCGMRSLPNDRDHLEDWIALLKDYPRLYGDTAALFVLRPRKLARALDRPFVVDRLVHGSDWPVPQNSFWFWGVLGRRALAAVRRESNPLRRDVIAKRALGLPDAVFTRGWDLVRPAPPASAASPTMAGGSTAESPCADR